MKKNNLKLNFTELLDNLLLLNLFLVIFFAIYFLVAVIFQINGYFTPIEFLRRLWNPLIIPLISILIFSSLISAFISWLRKRGLIQDQDI